MCNANISNANMSRQIGQMPIHQMPIYQMPICQMSICEMPMCQQYKLKTDCTCNVLTNSYGFQERLMDLIVVAPLVYYCQMPVGILMFASLS